MRHMQVSLSVRREYQALALSTVSTAWGAGLIIGPAIGGLFAQQSNRTTQCLSMHQDALTWLQSPPDQSLALLLADNGFDVWLSSTRGTKYSRGHTSLSTSDVAYWDWSWDELVAYDLPAIFLYVSSNTRQKLHYVGHSVVFFVQLQEANQSHDPEVSQRS